MFGIFNPEFKLLFTILFATYVYNSSTVGKQFITQFILSMAYNTIYYYSHCQIQINKLLIIINPYVSLLREYILTNDKSIYMIELFKDGVKTDDIITENNNIIDKELFLQNEFDLIVISDFTKPVPINKLCINNIPNNIKDYEVSNVRFISFKLIYGNDNIVNIELNNNDHNFYVVNNVFDKSFFKYYILNISKLKIPNDFSYNIELIDNNINMHVLDDSYSITIYNDDYGITKQEQEIKEEVLEEVQDAEIKELQEVQDAEIKELEEVQDAEIKELEEVQDSEIKELEEEVLEDDRINSDEFVKLDNTHCIDF
jgi:hypothetical protein